MNRFNVAVERIDIFDERWYRLIIDGVEYNLPSVTTYQEALPKGAGFMEWLKNNADADKLRDEAGELGSEVHRLIDNQMKGELPCYNDIPTYIPEARRVMIWERYLMWLNWWCHLPELEVVSSEYIIYDLDLLYAGTVDLIARFNDEYFIFDWKTGNSIYNSASVQLSAYVKAYEKMNDVKISKAIIVHINPKLNKNGWREYEIDDIDYYFDIFLSCQKLWRLENKNAKPKYKILPTKITKELIEELRSKNGKSKNNK